VVVVNPASVIGPDDYTGSEFGVFCQRFWKGRIPFVFGGGTNFVDVRDVASGMLAAAESGRPRERYILGCANRSYTGFFSELAAAAHRPIRRLRLPTGFARAGAAIAESLGRERGKRPLLTSSQAKLLGLFFFYDCAKAERELGYQPRALSETIADTHDYWMVRREKQRRATRAA
jgi:dihydroflavonol-4-reductase